MMPTTLPTILETSRVPGLGLLYGLSVAAAAVSGFFCAMFIAILLYNYHFAYHPDLTMDSAVSETNSQGVPIFSSDPSYRQPASDPFNLLPTDYKEFLALKRQLSTDKANEEIKEKIRILDQTLRFNYFKRREVVARTAPFLGLAAFVFLVSTRSISVLRRKIPMPFGDSQVISQQAETERLRLGTVAVVGISTAIIGLAFGLTLFPTSPFENVLLQKAAAAQRAGSEMITQRAGSEAIAELPGSSAANPEVSRSTIALPAPVEEELAKNWPAFRGFDGCGVGQSAAPPVKWDAKTDENVLWKTDIPLPGKSSPVIWENRLFLSGADETKRQIYCFDTKTGKLLWTADAPSTPEGEKPVSVSEDTGFAAPTMVVDGHRAFALFANGDLVAVDFGGNVLWSQRLGIPESSYGFAASPALYKNQLIVQYDVGDGTGGKSKLYAFDINTGKVVWETPREIPNSWSSPIVKKIAGRDQIITCGDPFVISYNPEDGKEIWRCKCLGGDVGPSPVAVGNVVFVTNQTPRSTAIDASGTGDVTATNILWQGVNALPDTPSPFATEQYFLTLDSSGYLTAYDPANIKNKKAVFWELEIGGGTASFYSSPLRVGNFVYVFDKTEDEPKAFVIDLSKAATDDSGALTEESAAAMIVATNPMPESCVSSPAVLNGQLFIRGVKTVYCIENKK